MTCFNLKTVGCHVSTDVIHVLRPQDGVHQHGFSGLAKHGSLEAIG